MLISSGHTSREGCSAAHSCGHPLLSSQASVQVSTQRCLASRSDGLSIRTNSSVHSICQHRRILAMLWVYVCLLPLEWAPLGSGFQPQLPHLPQFLGKCPAQNSNFINIFWKNAFKPLAYSSPLPYKPMALSLRHVFFPMGTPLAPWFPAFHHGFSWKKFSPFFLSHLGDCSVTSDPITLLKLQCVFLVAKPNWPLN